MAFINDYLTEEEIERFERYNLRYHEQCSNYHKFLGTVKTRKGVSCTIDRERKIYLFNCGDNAMIRRDTLEPIIYFALVIEEEHPQVAYITLYLNDGLIKKDGYDLFWKMIKLNNNTNYSDKLILNFVKEAMSIHGYDGVPRLGKRIVKFDF